MANKTVAPIDISLSIKGAEKLSQLKGLFRDLGKTIKVTDGDIRSARDGINDYAKTSNQSEAVIKGQIKAFEGLREQAKRGGKVYSELSDDIAELKAELDGSSTAIEAQRKSILELASGAEATAKQLKAAADQLFELRKETKLDSVAFNALGKDIDALTTRVSALGEKTKQTAKENRAAVASVNATLAKYEASAQAQMAGAARREQIVRDEVLALSEKKKVTDELIKKENQLTAAIARGRQLSVQEGAREARRRIRAGAQVYTGRVELGDVDAFDQRLGELPQTTAALSQKLSELQDRLANTTRGGDQYVQVALRIAQVQREAAAATQGLGAALVKDLASGVAVRNQKNLREVIGQLQSEMAELNTETAEGSAKYAENARQVNNLQKELDGIANSYRNVTDMARQATAAQGQYANTAAASNYLRRGIVRAQEAATAEMARAITQGAAQTPLLLPAAGQTTAPGTGALRSGLAREVIAEEARLGGGGVGIPVRPQPGDVQAISAKRYMGPAGTPEQIDAARRAYISEAEATRANAEAKEAAARVEANYRAEIDKATQANNGSLRSSNRLRSALDEYRSTLPVASKEFANLTKQINRLDSRSEAVSRRMGRRRMSPMQMTQAAGAAISGGIFGGPEGFVGGVGGGLLGGVGGAFAGAAVGAQVGGLRRTLGEFASYAAQIEKLKIALEGITGTQTQYNRALSAAADVTNTLNVPQEVAIQGITRLTAAVKGAGGGVAEAELAFKNINSAIIATGGGSEQVQGAVTALVQIFSKGKVSAEEINQIAERLPGTFNKIAAASGRTGPELTKALQKGQVGLNDLMKFLVSLGEEYGELSEKIAGSSENAGARLQVAYNNMRIDVGNALKPIGAEFQDAFREFTEDITPALAELLPKVGKFVLNLAKNLDVLAAAAAAAAIAMGAVAVAGMKFMGFAGLGALLMKAAVGAGALAAALNPYVAIAAGAAALAVHLHKVVKEQERLNELMTDGAGSTKDIEQAIDSYSSKLRKAENRLKGTEGETKATGRAAKSLKKEIDELKDSLDRLKGTYDIRLNFERQGFKFDDKGLMEEFTVGGIVYGGEKGARAKALRKVDGTPLEGLKEFEGPKPDGKNDLAGTKDISKLEADLIIARTKLNEEDLLARKEFIRSEAEIARQLADAEPFHKRRAALAQIAQKEAEALARVDEEIKKGAEQMVKALADQRKERKQVDDQLKQSLAARKLELGLITQEEFNQLEIQRERARLQELQAGGFISAEGVEEQMNVFKQLINQTPIGKFVKQAEDSLNDLQTVAVNVAQGIGDAVGNALTNGITSLIEGTKNAKEVFADFLKSVGQILAQEGARMIATYIAIGVAKAFAGLTGGGSTEAASKAGSQINVAPSASSFQGGTDFAVPSHFKQYPLLAGKAGGGPVNAGRPYMVGERGPELFVPGQSGGIMRNEDMRRMMGSSPVGSQPSMNFTFETTNIGGTEYVSREQLESAMAATRRQAASDGAKRGMNMTLDRMQNSPRTRARVGIS